MSKCDDTDGLSPPAGRKWQTRSLMMLLIVVALLASSPAWAVGSVLAGIWDSSKCTQGGQGYRQSDFQVAATGEYTFHNAQGGYGWPGPVDDPVRIYTGGFNPASPSEHLLATENQDDYYNPMRVNLDTGIDYVLVMERYCEPAERTWVMAIIGPGSVISADVVAVPAFSSGAFEADDPIMRNICDDGWGSFPFTSRSRQSGPVRVSRDGLYYFANSQIYGVCVSVHSAPIDPKRLGFDLVASPIWGSGPFELKAGQDYYFLVQQGFFDGPQEFLYLILPSAPFQINPGMTDAWYNPATPGQGFYLDVMDFSNKVFLGWFTFEDAPVIAGAAGQRWITALGKYEGDAATLGIEWSRGGRFNSAEPAPTQLNDGTIELEFSDCTSGEIRFDWGDDATHPPGFGVIPIRRIANDSVAWCESLYAGPGMPGPL